MVCLQEYDSTVEAPKALPLEVRLAMVAICLGCVS